MKNILFAIVIGVMMSGCSYIREYLKQDEVRESFDSANDAVGRFGHTPDPPAARKTDSVLHDMWGGFDSSAARIRGMLSTITEVKSQSDSLIAYIDGLQTKLKTNAAGDADLNVSTRLLAEGPDGRLLREKLEDYKRHMTALMAPYPLSSPIPIDVKPLPSVSGKKVTWEKSYFNMVPKVAAVTILNKFKYDVVRTEVMCVERLSKEP